ncbi:MAG: hypothetical protein ABH885_02275 [Candidatus Omnitrophota bacterium]
MSPARALKIFIILILFIALSASAALYVFHFILINRLETAVLFHAEKALNRDISWDSFQYVFPSGIVIKGIRVDDAAGRRQTIASLTADIDLRMLFSSRHLSAIVYMKSFTADRIRGTGEIVLESGRVENPFNPLKGYSLKTAMLKNFRIKAGPFSLDNIQGIVSFTGKEISCERLSLTYKGIPHTLSFSLRNRKKAPSLAASINGRAVEAGLSLVKDGDILKISDFHCRLFDSKITARGEVSIEDDPVFLLQGDSVVEAGDIAHIGPVFRNIENALGLKGRINCDIYLRGPVRTPKQWEIILKCGSAGIGIKEYLIRDVAFSMTMQNGIIAVSSLTASPYGGTLEAGFQMNIALPNLPYVLKALARNIDIRGIVNDSPMRNKTLYGLFSLSLAMEGQGADTESIRGQGQIEIMNGNLGPMPLLTPLVGNIYAFFRKISPSLEDVDITGGSCSYIISDKKIQSGDIWLYGKMLNIYAQGYMDFDRRLNFEVRNEVKTDEKGGADWQKALLDFMAGFGKLISKAYLTGTLDKPKWRFEYFSNLGNSITNQLGKFFQGVLQ